MLFLKIPFVCIGFLFLLFSPLNLFPKNTDDPIIAEKGYHGKRYFGDLTTEYTIAASGKSALCTLYVSTVLVGIESLTATNPTYNFDVKVGLGSANGALTMNLVDSPLVSKLKGSFTYTVTGNNTSFSFKGDLVGWYSSLSQTH